jgi:hypothetical protein
MLSIGLWRWYINITVTIVNIINPPVFYLKPHRIVRTSQETHYVTVYRLDRLLDICMSSSEITDRGWVYNSNEDISDTWVQPSITFSPLSLTIRKHRRIEPVQNDGGWGGEGDCGHFRACHQQTTGLSVTADSWPDNRHTLGVTT